jgi:hypothetical protein
LLSEAVWRAGAGWAMLGPVDEAEFQRWCDVWELLSEDEKELMRNKGLVTDGRTKVRRAGEVQSGSRPPWQLDG